MKRSCDPVHVEGLSPLSCDGKSLVKEGTKPCSSCDRGKTLKFRKTYLSFYQGQGQGQGQALIGGIAGVSILLLLFTAAVIFFLIKRRKKEPKVSSTNDEVEVPGVTEKTADLKTNTEIEGPKENTEGMYIYTNAETEAAEEPLPKHASLLKDAKLKERSKAMAENEESLEEEFFSLVDYVKDNINKEMNVRTEGNNAEHNRYLDIGKTFIFCLL